MRNVAKVVVVAAAAGFAASSPAVAQDWDGAYAGVHGEYLWGDPDLDTSTPVNFLASKFDGVAGGITAGFNHTEGNLLLGVEGDFALSGADGQVDVFYNPPYEGILVDLDWLSTVRARAGYANDRFAIYATGGVAIGHLDVTGLDGTTVDMFDGAAVGYVVGVGSEVMLTGNLSAKAELLHVDLGNERVDQVAHTVQSVGLETTMARLGLNFHF